MRIEAGSTGPLGAFIANRPPMGGYLKPPAKRVVGDFIKITMCTTQQKTA